MALSAAVGLQLIGVAAATLLAAVFAAAVLGRRRRPRAPVVEGKPAPDAGCAVADGEGSAGDGGTDVIIVGAGVAGSALAYTLGKVAPFVPSHSFVDVYFHWFGEQPEYFRLKSVAFFLVICVLVAWCEEQRLVFYWKENTMLNFCSMT